MYKQINGGVCAAQGFSANGVHCGIRKNRAKKDLALIYSRVPASAAALYTTNLVKGAPPATFRTLLSLCCETSTHRKTQEKPSNERRS